MKAEEQIENIENLQLFATVVRNEVAAAHKQTPFEDEREALEIAHANLQLAIGELNICYQTKVERLKYIKG
jgi:hypothetical protein